ncbi:MAG: hypothetical protein WAV32_01790 [Halobacteriota archaeon]
MLQAQGKDNAIGFAMSEAIVRKNLMAINLIKKGLLPISKEDFQRGCIEGYFKPRAEKLGLERKDIR